MALDETNHEQKQKKSTNHVSEMTMRIVYESDRKRAFEQVSEKVPTHTDR